MWPKQHHLKIRSIVAHLLPTKRGQRRPNNQTIFIYHHWGVSKLAEFSFYFFYCTSGCQQSWCLCDIKEVSENYLHSFLQDSDIQFITKLINYFICHLCESKSCLWNSSRKMTIGYYLNLWWYKFREGFKFLVQADVIGKIKEICKYDNFNQHYLSGGFVYLIIVIVPLQRAKK